MPSRLLHEYYIPSFWNLWHLPFNDGIDCHVAEQFQAKTRILFNFIGIETALERIKFDIGRRGFLGGASSSKSRKQSILPIHRALMIFSIAKIPISVLCCTKKGDCNNGVRNRLFLSHLTSMFDKPNSNNPCNITQAIQGILFFQ